MKPPRPPQDLVQNAKIETNKSGNITEHVFYEPGPSPLQRTKRRVERWNRGDVLGRGAFGIVYQESRTCGSTRIFRAVKEISKLTAQGEKLDYHRELEAILKFSHAKYAHCFVRSDGWFEINDSVFISMEYMKLGDLQRHLVQPLPEAEASQITQQLLEGLQLMHENGFVHRDLKPANIMVVDRGPNWFVKIADFGISKRRHQGLTTTQTMNRGTMGFAAPEVFGAKTGSSSMSNSFALDMWSLGAVVHYLLTKAVVFGSMMDIFQYATGSIELPTEKLVSTGISNSASDFIKTLLVAKPEARPSALKARGHEWVTSPVQSISTEGAPEFSLEESTGPGDTIAESSIASAAWTKTLQDERPILGPKTASTPSNHGSLRNESTENSKSSQGGFGSNNLPFTTAQEASLAGPGASDVASTPTSTRDIHDESDAISGQAWGNSLGSLFTLGENSPKPRVDDENSDCCDSEREHQNGAEEEEAVDTEFETENETDSEIEVNISGTQQSRAEHSTLWPDPTALDERRTATYFPQLASLFVDTKGAAWPAPSLEPNTLPNFIDEDDECEFWNHQELWGNAIRLNEDASPNEDASYEDSFGTCHVCHQVVEGPFLRMLTCHHRHCLECLVWAFQTFVIEDAEKLPRCCSRLVSFTFVRNLFWPRLLWPFENIGLSTCKSENCNNLFQPKYIVRSPHTGGWVECCPKCSQAMCFACRKACTGEGQSPIPSQCSGCHGALFYGSASQLKNRRSESTSTQRASSLELDGLPDLPTETRENSPRQSMLIDQTYSVRGSRSLPRYSIPRHTTTASVWWPRSIRYDAGYEEWRMAATQQTASEVTQDRQKEFIGLTKSRSHGAESRYNGAYMNHKWSREKYIICWQCGREDERMKTATGYSNAVLDCAHRMCDVCLVQWFAVALVSPVHNTPPCSECPAEGELGYLHPERLSGLEGITTSLAKLARIYTRLKQLGSWLCPEFNHGRQPLVFYTGSPMSWRQHCKECSLDYCLRCSCVWHTGRRCIKAAAVASFVEELRASGKFGDLTTQAFIDEAMDRDSESLLLPDRARLFGASIDTEPDLFGMNLGQSCSATYLHGDTREQLLMWLSTCQRDRADGISIYPCEDEINITSSWVWGS